MTDTLHHLLARELARPDCALSMGCFGALAEFHDGAACPLPDGDLGARSAHGAYRLDLRLGHELVPCAYEALGAAGGWQVGIALTVSRRRHGGPGRRVLTELGADDEALADGARAARLFDLGVGAPNVEYCVRSTDPTLLEHLRRHVGERVCVAGHPLLDILVAASPHRVVRSAAGRIEIYQAIDRHRTPDGPHTHLLPDLLVSGRTHAANLPLPRGTMPVLTLHPPHPLRDAHGRARPFDRAVKADFDAVLERYGEAAYRAEKARLRAALGTGLAPTAYAPPTSRPARLALRIGLRQMRHETADAVSAAWHARFRP